MKRQFYFDCAKSAGSCCLGTESESHSPESMRPYIATNTSGEKRLVNVCESHYRFNTVRYGWRGMEPVSNLCFGCNHVACQDLIKGMRL
jgi:hypothetical protein